MKTLFTILVSVYSVSVLANELQWVDEQIEAIKPSRSGISKAKINSIKSPFIFLNKTSTKSTPLISSTKLRSINTKSSPSKRKNIVAKRSQSLNLEAVINKSALINGKWYKLNEKVGKYTLSFVSTKQIVLSYKKKELLLSTVSKSNRLKFKSN